MDNNRNNPSGNPNNPGGKPDGKKRRNPLVLLLASVALVLLLTTIYNAIVDSKYTETSYSDFLTQMEAGNLYEVEFQSDRIIYMTKDEHAKDANDQKACFTGLPTGGDTMLLAEKLHAQGVKVKEHIEEDNSMLMMILSYALMIGGLFLIMNLFTRRMGEGGMGAMGKSSAKVYMEKQTGVTFKDVAGQDEAKESL